MDAVRDRIPDYARDLRLNLATVLTPQGAPGLSESQLWMTALASAIASRNAELARAVEAAAVAKLAPAEVEAARAAAAIMGMNNVYYRFVHLVEDEEYSKLPAKLRMNVIGNPGIAKADFELVSLAVSAVNGCGKCVTAHEPEVDPVFQEAGTDGAHVRQVAGLHPGDRGLSLGVGGAAQAIEPCCERTPALASM